LESFKAGAKPGQSWHYVNFLKKNWFSAQKKFGVQAYGISGFFKFHLLLTMVFNSLLTIKLTK